jgi:hypothetical protein
MGWKRQLEPEARPVVDWLAGQIHDPVAKLRFLKIAAPDPLPSGRKSRKLRPRYIYFAIFCVLAALLLVRARTREGTAAPRHALVSAPPRPENRPAGEPPLIWEVERTADYEVYSNGLRIETRYETSNHPRRYVAFAADHPGREPGETRNTPVGIIFHATGSRQAPFEEDQNRVLKRLGESMLDYVRRKRAYNFVIDRFGRVYRVVRESDAANHAGYSLWSDDRWIYINLNESFLGVSFEAGAGSSQYAELNPAQQRAGAVLVEMLRSRYRIAAADCVTHAQVSVNPDNMRVGYHTDWASGFPFESVGLPNNYEQPIWAVASFGFECDPAFLEQAAGRLQEGAKAAEAMLLRAAAGKGMKPAAYRIQLRHQYREKLALARHVAAGSGSTDSDQVSAIK